MLFGGAHHQSCLLLQTDIAWFRQESPIRNDLYEDTWTGKLYPEMIVSDFGDIEIRGELAPPYS